MLKNIEEWLKKRGRKCHSFCLIKPMLKQSKMIITNWINLTIKKVISHALIIHRRNKNLILLPTEVLKN